MVKAGSEGPTNLLIFVEPPSVEPHAVVVWGGCPATGILTRFRRGPGPIISIVVRRTGGDSIANK
jgi:hypothetical protein